MREKQPWSHNISMPHNAHKRERDGTMVVQSMACKEKQLRKPQGDKSCDKCNRLRSRPGFLKKVTDWEYLIDIDIALHAKYAGDDKILGVLLQSFVSSRWNVIEESTSHKVLSLDALHNIDYTDLRAHVDNLLHGSTERNRNAVAN